MRVTKFLLTLVAFAAFFLVPAVAFAGTGDLSGVDDWLRNAVVGAAVGGIVAAARWLWNKGGGAKVAKVINQHRLLQLLADEAIDYAEEQARKMAKRAEGAVKAQLSGAEKKSAALRYLLDLARKHKLGAKAKEELEGIIEARLGASRKAGSLAIRGVFPDAEAG